jgi:hypothetical protein
LNIPFCFDCIGRRFAKSGSADDCIRALEGRWARAPRRTRPGSVRREYATNRFYL